MEEILNIPSKAKWALGGVAALVVLLIACGGTNWMTCDEQKERCRQKCADLGWGVAVNTCYTTDIGAPISTCTCSPSSPAPEPGETEGMEWDLW